MSRTATEKILSRVVGRDVRAGDIVYPEPDLVTIHDWFVANCLRAVQDLGVKRLHAPERLLVCTDHEPTAVSKNAANRQQQVRVLVRQFAVGKFFDVGRGGHGHVFPMEMGIVRPGMFVAGWDPHVTGDGAEALAYVRTTPPDLVLLDVMLPGLSGLEVCRALRADPTTAAIPIIMLTARVEEADRIAGLEMGADDYISKPFSPSELLARIKALMRRSQRRDAKEPTLRLGPIVMDLASHTVSSHGREVKLTAKEFMLLQYLLEHRGRVLSRDLLLSDVWGYRYTGGTRTVDVHVRRLREKLPVLIDSLVTIKQFGYKLADDTPR